MNETSRLMKLQGYHAPPCGGGGRMIALKWPGLPPRQKNSPWRNFFSHVAWPNPPPETIIWVRHCKCKVMEVPTSQHIICCADDIVSENDTVVCNYPRSYAQNRNNEGFSGSMALVKAVAWDGYPGQTRPQNARSCTASYLSPTQRCPFNFSKTKFELYLTRKNSRIPHIVGKWSNQVSKWDRRWFQTF